MNSENNSGMRVGIEYKLPLWGILVTLGTGFVMLVGQFYNVQTLTATVQELQIIVKSGNTAFSVLSSEMALQKFRIGTMESDLAQIKEILRQQGKGGK